jgi:predicted neutral ceramidase superfamily lipid hydrolase
MATKGGYDKFLNSLNPFSRAIPKTTSLFVLLLVMSVIMGIAAVALINYSMIATNFSYILVNGSITGILVIMLPTLLTILIVKSVKSYIDMKYIFFISIIGTFAYSLFIILGSIVYILTHDYAIAAAIILVGDASIYGWWFFANKVVLGQKKKAAIFALVQPTLNILLYIPSSRFILTFTSSFNILLVRLYAGIFIFLLVSYAIIYIVDRPYNKSYGFHSFEAVSQLMQNWLFDINISTPFGQNFGTPTDIRTDTLIFRTEKGAMKAIFFAPDIHYGPSGTLGGSDFPYLLEHYSVMKYQVPTFVMHRTVDMDHNPVSSSQFNQLKESFDNSIKASKRITKQTSFTYSEGRHAESKVMRLSFGEISLVTLTRAPRVTEDVAIESAVIFNELLEAKIGTTILLDAHNSRYEGASKTELDGVKFNSRFMNDYIKAIKDLGGRDHKTKNIKVGVSSRDVYTLLGHPIDIAKGNLNVAVFQFNEFKYAIIQFNANNVLPQLRNAIVKHIKRKYNVNAELYTTDTHAVNSLEYTARNVLGRYTKHEKIIEQVDKAMKEAMLDIEPVTVSHNKGEMKKFKVWGPDIMESMLNIAKSTYGITRLLVPLIVVVGFIVAAWLILVI